MHERPRMGNRERNAQTQTDLRNDHGIEARGLTNSATGNSAPNWGLVWWKSACPEFCVDQFHFHWEACNTTFPSLGSAHKTSTQSPPLDPKLL